MQVTIRGIFLVANPFITAYNTSTNKYHSPYYVENVRPLGACVFLRCLTLSAQLLIRPCGRRKEALNA